LRADHGRVTSDPPLDRSARTALRLVPGGLSAEVDGDGAREATGAASRAVEFVRSLRITRFAGTLAIVAVLVWSFWLPREVASFDYATRSHGANWDFRVYYAAGHNWSLGLDPYARQPAPPMRAGGIRPIRFVGQHTIRFIYPPTLLPAYRWIAHLPYHTARVVWRDLNFGALAAAGLLSLLFERQRRLEVGAALLLLGVVSSPLLYHVRQGNVDMIVAGLATCGFLLYGRYRSWPAAVLLALAIVAKLTPLLVVAALVAYYRDWRFLLRTTVAVAVLVGLSALVVPLRFYGQAAQVLFVRSQSMTFWENQSAMRLLASDSWAPRYVGGAAFVGLVVALHRLGRRRQARLGDRGSPALPDVKVFMLTVLVMLLFSPIAWVWTYVWIIVPTAMLLAGRQRRRGVAAPVMLVAAAALMSAPVAHRGPVQDSLTMIGGGIALVTLVLCCLGVLDGERRAARTTGPDAASVRVAAGLK
jgi:hypothetical protein